MQSMTQQNYKGYSFQSSFLVYGVQISASWKGSKMRETRDRRKKREMKVMKQTILPAYFYRLDMGEIPRHGKESIIVKTLHNTRV